MRFAAMERWGTTFPQTPPLGGTWQPVGWMQNRYRICEKHTGDLPQVRFLCREPPYKLLPR